MIIDKRHAVALQTMYISFYFNDMPITLYFAAIVKKINIIY